MLADRTEIVRLGQNDLRNFFKQVLAKLIEIIKICEFAEFFQIFYHDLDTPVFKVADHGHHDRDFAVQRENSTFDIPPLVADFLQIKLEVVGPQVFAQALHNGVGLFFEREFLVRGAAETQDDGLNVVLVIQRQAATVYVVVGLVQIIHAGGATLKIIDAGDRRLDHIEGIKQLDPVMQSIFQLGMRKQQILADFLLRNLLLLPEGVGLLF